MKQTLAKVIVNIILISLFIVDVVAAARTPDVFGEYIYLVMAANLILGGFACWVMREEIKQDIRWNLEKSKAGAALNLMRMGYRIQSFGNVLHLTAVAIMLRTDKGAMDDLWVKQRSRF